MQLAERDGRLNRLETVNQELMRHIIFLDKQETLYVGSTFDQARQGLFKVTRTIGRPHDVVHNDTHPHGDDFVILYKIKCGNALQLEQRVRYILKYFKPVTNRKYYQIPFSLLVRAIEQLELDLDNEEQLANELIDALNELKLTKAAVDWMNGVPQDIFALPAPVEVSALLEPSVSTECIGEPLKPVEVLKPSEPVSLPVDPVADLVSELAPQVIDKSVESPALVNVPMGAVVSHVFTYKVGDWTSEQTREFIINVLPEYNNTCGRRGPSWTTVKKFLTKKLKSFSKQPKLDTAKQQIIELCLHYDIKIK